MNKTVNLTYEVVSEKYPNERNSYGIAVCEDKIPLEIISDLSEKYEAVAKLARICNELRLSPEHIYDVIDDFLNQ